MIKHILLISIFIINISSASASILNKKLSCKGDNNWMNSLSLTSFATIHFLNQKEVILFVLDNFKIKKWTLSYELEPRKIKFEKNISKTEIFFGGSIDRENLNLNLQSKSFTCEIISESISIEKQIYSFQKELIEKQKLKNKI